MRQMRWFVFNIAFVVLGVYLSKHSDLLQINPFEAGSFGDIIVFKVMRVGLKLLVFCAC